MSATRQMFRECACGAVAFELATQAMRSREEAVKKTLNSRADAYLAASALRKRGTEVIFRLLGMQNGPISERLANLIRRVSR